MLGSGPCLPPVLVLGRVSVSVLVSTTLDDPCSPGNVWVTVFVSTVWLILEVACSSGRVSVDVFVETMADDPCSPGTVRVTVTTLMVLLVLDGPAGLLPGPPCSAGPVWD